MLICLDLHALCFMPCFPMLCSSFCSTLMLGLHAHVLVRCFWPCFYAYMSRFMFSHAFMLTSTCLDVHFHAYMHISMLICVDRCVYILRSLFSTFFMPSSMCLRASCHVYVPRLCLSCHVLL